MIDVFILLAPLIFPAIIMLFVFVGCTGNIGDVISESLPVTLTLTEVDGFESGVLGIEITFNFGDESIARTLNQDQIVPGANEVAYGLILLHDSGPVSCKCTITMASLPERNVGATQNKLIDEPLVDFVLIRTGDDFSVGTAM